MGQPFAAATLGFLQSSETTAALAASAAASNKAAAADAAHAGLDDFAGLQYGVEAGVLSGFQLATAAGPLCDEPMWAIAFEVSIKLLAVLSKQSTIVLGLST